ncbi:LysR family transcriptional regulator [Streptomyces sp. NPDC005890]|uniref:LysR family transcriptional regulator n=1 Tax=Streptomyces sp. NPDC005890 TaxID=3154568 RepID=UPI0033D8B509
MEVREIEIFLTLAEELHFGRAAARLHLTQARVSQVIGRQERPAARCSTAPTAVRSA